MEQVSYSPAFFKIQVNVNFTSFTERKKGLKCDDKQRTMCQMINTQTKGIIQFSIVTWPKKQKKKKRLYLPPKKKNLEVTCKPFGQRS
jgi:hypothetical protein